MCSRTASSLPRARNVQSNRLYDVLIPVTKNSVPPRSYLAGDPGDVAAEHFCSVFAAVETVARRLIMPNLARPLNSIHHLARQNSANISYWARLMRQTARPREGKSLRPLVGNNGLIVDWDTAGDLALLRIGVGLSKSVSLSPDAEVGG